MSAPRPGDDPRNFLRVVFHNRTPWPLRVVWTIDRVRFRVKMIVGDAFEGAELNEERLQLFPHGDVRPLKIAANTSITWSGQNRSSHSAVTMNIEAEPTSNTHHVTLQEGDSVGGNHG